MAKQHKRGLGKWSLLIIAIILGIILSLVNFLAVNPSREYVSARIELLYDGAADGLAPNGEKFSIDNLKDEAILSAALEECGLADKISLEELSRNIVIRGAYPSNIIDQIKSFKSLLTADPTREVSLKEYHPTTFSATIYNEFSSKIESSKLRSLMSAILDKYKTYYVGLYDAGMDSDTLSAIYNIEDYDYAQTIKLMRTRLNIIQRYAGDLYTREPSFMDENNNTFDVLSTKVDTLVNNDIQGLSANITINALSKDTERLIGQYEYEVKVLGFQTEALNEYLEKLNALIDSYKKDSTIYMSSGDSVITVEGNSEETYESLVDNKVAVTNLLASIKTQIDDYNGLIEDLKTGMGTRDTEAATKRMESQLESTWAKITALKADFDALAAKYNEKFVSQNDVRIGEVKYHGNSVASTAYIKTLFKSEAPLCALALIVIFAIGLVQEIKAQKKPAEAEAR